MLTPEQKARKEIDKQLKAAGWIIQDIKRFNPTQGLGIAVTEYQTDTGPADYALFVNGKAIGVIEAKKEEEGERITVHEIQTERYAHSQLKWVKNNEPLPFLYESTGTITQFTDIRDPKPRSRRIFSFHRPEQLQSWFKQENTLRSRLQQFPKLNEDGLRKCQIKAIKNLEVSFGENRPRALIQMATGAGKTFTAITAVYRLLKFADAKRILFLVDTKNLGKQTEQEFMAFSPNDDPNKFIQLYNVQRLNSSFISPDSQVCISTIQRMYSILKGKDLDDSAEETNPNELKITGQPREVEYNDKIPPGFFDFIIIDECHRSIYNLWRQVLDYFDAFQIGLTATPDKRTFGYFEGNVVSEYTHEEAVTDGVNVGYEIYSIETKITKQGAIVEAGEYVDKRHRMTRKKRWNQLDEDVAYAGKDLDRDVVNPSQIRQVVRTFREKLKSELFPKRKEVPKTLIFAKSDSHADDIIKIVRKEFGEGNRFCRKITYLPEKTEEGEQPDKDSPDRKLNDFRTDFYPRIAVTVDMIATGTDVKPIECLLFMRDVKSKNYFVQMKGRGTRTYKKDDLQKVTPSATTNKTHFVIVDAVGVTKSVKTDDRPLERKKSVSLKDLMMSVVMGPDDEDTLTSLASRLTRMEKQIDEKEKERFVNLTEGKTINAVAKELLNAFDTDKLTNRAREHFSLPNGQMPTDHEIQQVQALAIEAATLVFSDADVRDFIENTRKKYEQVIDDINQDEVTFAGWDKQAAEKAEGIVQDFRQFIEDNRDEITAIKIFYQQPYQQRTFTFRMIKEVLEKLQASKPHLAPLRVWQAYEQLGKVKTKSPEKELVALVSLLRHVTGIDEALTPYDGTVDRNFQNWVFRKQAGALKFNEEQMDWLRMIKNHIAASFHIEREDFDYSPFDAEGGIGKMYQLFGGDMDTIIDELNVELAA
ncbi:MAG: type I restriction-modification enzyme R subunit C-terminal domain-containing protein [Bacteroidota bacterium]